ncbi:MFS transporter [Sporichthya sp.]|uniref:MFS transporter n=1 Tax=Sporichthya sp. TaxID=65475 RepID=UPI00179242FA|nr:MFS transporter [Sporichthya sp.]MBA3741755.1 MFS transporter [Sporichthya sp.]
MTVDQAGVPAAPDAPEFQLEQDAVPCRRPKLAVALMCLTVAVIYGSGTILFTALSTVAEELEASQTQLVWIAGMYPLVIAALLLPGGAFVDRVGRKVGAVLGLAITASFFLAASQTNSADMVLLFLGLAGIGGAMSFPATLATITAVVPRERRGPAVGLWSASLFIGGVTGTTLGGVLSEWLAWQWLLIGPAVLGLLAIVPILIWVPESRDVRNAHVDVLGAVLSVLAVGLFVFGMTEAPEKGFADPLTLTALLGLVFGVLFVWSQLRDKRPMLDLRLFKDGRFGSGSLVNLLSWFMTYGFFFTAVQYRYYTLDFGPLLTGLSFAPSATFIIPLAIVGPKLARKYGSRPVMVLGLMILAVGSVGIALTATTQKFWPVAICEAIAFSGLALVGGPATESIIDALPPAKHGVASAVNDITRQLGIALGVAVLGTLFNAAYRADVATDGVLDDVVEATKDSAAEGLALAAGLPDSVREAQESAIANAVTLGFVVASLALALALAIGAWVVWRRCPAEVGKAVEADFTAEAWAEMKLDPALDPAQDRPSVSVAAMAALAPIEAPLQASLLPPPPSVPAAIPLSVQLTQAAARYADLLEQAQARHADLEADLVRLRAHEAEVRRRCAEAHAEHASALAALAELANAGEDWLDRAFVDPIAAPLVERG